MNIGEPVRVIEIPRRDIPFVFPLPAEPAIAVPDWPTQTPAEAPVEAPDWPVPEPAETPEKAGAR